MHGASYSAPGSLSGSAASLRDGNDSILRRTTPGRRLLQVSAALLVTRSLTQSSCMLSSTGRCLGMMWHLVVLD